MNILVCVDLSGSTEMIVKSAGMLAKGSSAKLWVLHAAEPEPDFVGLDVGPQSVRDQFAETFHHEHRQVQEIAERMRDEGFDATALLVQGASSDVILQQASALQADTIVIGTHGKGAVYQLLVGSVSERVIQKAACPIFVVPTHGRG